MFKEMIIDEYLKQLASSEPTPGGGAAAALTSAQGAALLCMVTRLSIGKPAYAEFEDHCMAVLAEAEKLLERLSTAVDRDAEVFEKLMEAYQDPDADDETQGRMICAAAAEAARAPLAVMKDSLRGIELAESLIGHSNTRLESDLKAASDLLEAGIKASSYMVEVNLPAVRKGNATVAEDIDKEMNKILRLATLAQDEG